jgi:hypothetical protein
MKTSPPKRHPAGYISLMLVIVTGTILTVLMINSYNRAMAAKEIQADVQLRLDYSEKEEAILRSIVAIAPNRAIRTMQSGSNLSATTRDPLNWQNLFTDALILANARNSISSDMITTLNVPNLRQGNSGDSALGTPSRIFAAIPSETGFVSAGINRSLGTGYPPPLTSTNTTTNNRDVLYPIISNFKKYGTLAQSHLNSATLNGNGTVAYGLPVGTYPDFNLLEYPSINFGYAKPGDRFVAKRNWWAFSVDVADHDDDKTFLARSKRNFVLSLYEIPSQLAISASSFMSLGQYASGDAWRNVNIDGGLFVGKADVRGTTAINSLSSRRGMTLSSGTTIGGQSFANSPFTPGVRESFQNQQDATVPVALSNQTTLGSFFPVSQASESGRAAFIPINRGADYFDRFSHTTETSVLSTTTWNNYSVGALQCAMQLDITSVTSSTNLTPTMLRYSYLLSNGTRTSMNVPLTSAVQTTLPAGYVKVCDEGQSFTFSSTEPVDIAYGISGGFTFRQGVTGTIAFDNNTFGDPKVGSFKAGYWRPRTPFEIRSLVTGQICVAVYPTRFPAFLTTIGAATSATNSSLVVNVDYSTTGLNNAARKPAVPCTSNDYGVILRECSDITGYPKGFSLVTNLRLYIGDDFNVVATTPPSGYTPAITTTNPSGLFYPPCSLFAPEKRYGVDVAPYGVNLNGQIGSLASDTATTAIRPLDSRTMTGTSIDPSAIVVNLRPIAHPAELPPITMMNWLVILEERRREYF